MMRHATTTLLPAITAAVLWASACGPLRPSSRAAPSGGEGDDLTQAELLDYSTVLEAVQALRPIWLRLRTPLLLTESASPVWIYWDGTRLGDTSYLGRITTSQVARVVHYDARAASLRWGISHENGVIYVMPIAGAQPPAIR